MSLFSKELIKKKYLVDFFVFENLNRFKISISIHNAIKWYIKDAGNAATSSRSSI